MKRRADVGKEEKTSSHSRITASFKAGAIALAFLVIGYQSALFIRSAAVARLVSHRDVPDTVFVIDDDHKLSVSEILDGFLYGVQFEFFHISITSEFNITACCKIWSDLYFISYIK